jgi:hypothetical protein
MIVAKLTTAQFEKFALNFPDSALLVMHVHKNPVPYRGASTKIAFNCKDGWVDDLPKPVALKLLRRLNHLEEDLIARLGRPLLKG